MGAPSINDFVLWGANPVLKNMHRFIAAVTLLPAMLWMASSIAICRSGMMTERDIRDLTLRGLTFAYNFRFDSANVCFERAIALDPAHPRPHLGQASMNLWLLLISNKEEERTRFLDRSDRVLTIAGEYVDRHVNNGDALVCLGITYCYRSFANARAKNYLTAAWEAKRGFDILTDALAADSQSYDAYLGIGVLRFVTSFLPKPLQWIAGIMGISADPAVAIREIRVAVEKSAYMSVDAQYILSQLLPWHTGEFDSSGRILSGLKQRFPSNALLEFTLAVWDIRKHRITAARDRLAALIGPGSGTPGGVLTFAHNRLAECYFRLGDFSRAKHHYRLFLSGYSDDLYRATALYRIGLIYEINGRRDSAIEYYAEAASADGKFGDDAYSSRRAAHLLRVTLTREDTLLLLAQNALQNGAYNEALRRFEECTATVMTGGDYRAEAEYGIAESLFETGSFGKAVTHYKAVLSMEVDTEQWLYPWSRYRIGLCHRALGNTALARTMFEDIGDYGEYDYQNWLSFRSARELASLEH